MESVGSKLQSKQQPPTLSNSQNNSTAQRQSTAGMSKKQSSFSLKRQQEKNVVQKQSDSIIQQQNVNQINNSSVIANTTSLQSSQQLTSSIVNPSLITANTYGEKNSDNGDLQNSVQINSKSQTQRLNSSIISGANQQYTSNTNKNSGLQAQNTNSSNNGTPLTEKQNINFSNNNTLTSSNFRNLISTNSTVIDNLENKTVNLQHQDTDKFSEQQRNGSLINQNDLSEGVGSRTCMTNKTQNNIFYNPQGGDTESCLNNQTDNQTSQQESNGEDEDDDEGQSTSYLNPFSKSKKGTKNTNSSRTNTNSQQLIMHQSQKDNSDNLQFQQNTHHHHHHKHRIHSEDGSGSDFSAEEGSPHDNKKHGRKVLQMQQMQLPSDSNNGYKESTSELSGSSPGLLKEYQRLKDIDKYLIPPPEDLIAKTVFMVEPIRTGAPISFVKTDILRGDERYSEQMSNVKQKSSDLESAQQTRSGLRYIAEEIVKSEKDNKVVYCRFGKQYINNLEKQMNSILNANGQSSGPNGTNTQLSQAIKGATYLINIKKLIKEHNIDTEYNNFQKLRTKQNVVNKQGDNGPALPYYTLENEQDKTLLFESRFESGNLLCAIKISDNEYDLVLQNDINTNGHTQWYFFRVSNATQGMKVKFNILNLAKTDSLYNDGMKILAFSASLKKTKGLGWHRVGSEISYYQNAYRRENMRQARYYYTFTFTHEFEGTDQDSVYFTHCFPYTYSDLQDDLSRIEKDQYTQNFFYRNTLCRTLAGNKCEYITITSKEKDPMKNGNSNHNQDIKTSPKMGVFLSARVHPGESNASWMMKGLIDFLVSNTPEARVLREKFVFKIVPMINPDGVINGNYRCSLCGSDLNRRWKTPSKVLHPVVFAIKRMVKAFSKEREIALYCDFHGHSRRKNIFMYGNNYQDKPDATRVFPYILSKLCDFFSFEYSRFSMHKSKESTARIAMWKELKIPNIFTLEASFSGADKGALKDQHFTTEHLMLCGRKLLESLIVYCKIDVQASLNELNFKGSKKKQNNQIEQEEVVAQSYLEFNVDSLQKELCDNKELLKMTEGKEEGDGEGSSGSDSDPSEDNLEEEEMAKIVPIKIKKKKPDPKKKSLTDARALKKKVDELPKNKVQEKPQQKPMTRSPVKKIFNYSNPLYDRLKLRQMKKIEMVDAWTQTSDRGSDNEEGHKLRRVGSQANQKSKNSLLMGTTATQSFVLSNLNQVNALDQQPVISSQNSDPFFSGLNQSQKVVTMQDSGSSPQPQYRIRKEPFKQPSMPASLSKFEEKLINCKNNNNQNNASGAMNVESLNQLQFSNNKIDDSMSANNNNSSRLSKTPKDRLNLGSNNNNNVSNISSTSNGGQNILGMTHNQSMKLNKTPYTNQVYGEFSISNNDQTKNNNSNNPNIVTDNQQIPQHSRHFSSENFQGFNMQPVQNTGAIQNNALSSRGISSQQQKDNSNNNISTVITSPKQQIKNSKHLSSQKYQTSKMGNNGSLQEQQQQQRFRSSLIGKQQQESGEVQNKNMIQMMTQGNFTNQRQSIQNSIDKSGGNNRIISNKKRLPEINDAQRLSQKTTIEQSQNNQNAFIGTNLLQHQFIPGSAHQKQQSHSQYKYQLNSSAQQIVRNQNIYNIQQSLIKNYGPGGQQPPEQILYQTNITKSMDRNSYGAAQRSIYQNLSSNQVVANISNPTEYQNRVMQNQIQLQNVKQSNQNSNYSAKAPQKYL